MDDIRGDDASQSRGRNPGHSGAPVTSIENGPDVSRVAGLDETVEQQPNAPGPVERAPERDERGRL